MVSIEAAMVMWQTADLAVVLGLAAAAWGWTLWRRRQTALEGSAELHADPQLRPAVIWSEPRTLTVAGHTLALTRKSPELISARWMDPGGAVVSSVGRVSVSRKQTVIEVLADPRACVPTLDPDFDRDLEIGLDPGASELVAALVCTFTAELRGVVRELVTHTGAEVQIPLLPPSAGGWRRAIDQEPVAAARIRATLLAGRDEDALIAAREAIGAIVEGFRAMEPVPIRIRRRWVRAMSVGTGPFGLELAEAIARDGETSLVQLWLPAKLASAGPLDAAERRGLHTVLAERSEEPLLTAAIRVLGARGGLGDVVALSAVADSLLRAAEVRQAAQDAILGLQAKVPGAQAGSLALAEGSVDGGVAVAEEEVVVGGLSEG